MLTQSPCQELIFSPKRTSRGFYPKGTRRALSPGFAARTNPALFGAFANQRALRHTMPKTYPLAALAQSVT